jgi:hypothetical protein
MPARTLLFVFMVKLLDGERSGFLSLDGRHRFRFVPSACDKPSYMFRANFLTGWCLHGYVREGHPVEIFGQRCWELLRAALCPHRKWLALSRRAPCTAKSGWHFLGAGFARKWLAPSDWQAPVDSQSKSGWHLLTDWQAPVDSQSKSGWHLLTGSTFRAAPSDGHLPTDVSPKVVGTF